MATTAQAYASYESPPSPPATSEELESVPTLAKDAFQLLSEQESKMMDLGDFIAELRDLDLRTAVIDEILDYMTTNAWVQLWAWKGTEETWISVVE